ncbi:hypothetical protein HAX54_018575 [Datura stramonium]|uniref:Uncharacterized protein n=1 Tax=Datura stramonium TaxID=4076 RepID=A0ABS8S3Q4_DATST|nr:hypothetical protein [Datura stramonium]
MAKDGGKVPFFNPVRSLEAVLSAHDSNRPFGLVVKTGVGSRGSPIEAPLTMSAEFNFPGQEKKSGKVTWADLFVAEKAVEGLFGGEVHARTVFPIMDKVVGKIGWSLKFRRWRVVDGEMPYMVVNKLGSNTWKDKAGIDRTRGSDGDVAEMCQR